MQELRSVPEASVDQGGARVAGAVRPLPQAHQGHRQGRAAGRRRLHLDRGALHAHPCQDHRAEGGCGPERPAADHGRGVPDCQPAVRGLPEILHPARLERDRAGETESAAPPNADHAGAADPQERRARQGAVPEADARRPRLPLLPTQPCAALRRLCRQLRPADGEELQVADFPRHQQQLVSLQVHHPLRVVPDLLGRHRVRAERPFRAPERRCAADVVPQGVQRHTPGRPAVPPGLGRPAPGLLQEAVPDRVLAGPPHGVHGPQRGRPSRPAGPRVLPPPPPRPRQACRRRRGDRPRVGPWRQ
mmetsp:Transcript_27568/g.83120  ORF Transcript_27568/g.83120 Transcript_27568/m.83120 type:complete len:304 (+) Transcript_27568:230-1141(+)